jgi:hypothetical protein
MQSEYPIDSEKFSTAVSCICTRPGVETAWDKKLTTTISFFNYILLLTIIAAL